MNEDPTESDHAFLDALLDRVLREWSEGRSPRPEDLLEGRLHLRSEFDAMLDIARGIAVRVPAMPTVVPGYEILRELGRGAMGTVFLARQSNLGRTVALKALPPAYSASPRARERFLVEARSLARLDHGNVVKIHDVIVTEEIAAYVMEFIPGRTLASIVGERLDSATACRMVRQLASALAAVHHIGLVHRDVKPSNVVVREDGAPVLVDFGLVRAGESDGLTHSGEFLGTLGYAAPEQLRGDRAAIGPHSDIYSLGATLHHALTGQPPYVARTATEQLELAMREARPSLTRFGLPRDLETIVATCLEPDPVRRYSSADLLADDLDRVSSLRPIRARPATMVSRLAKYLRRNRTALVSASVAGLVVFVMAIAALWFQMDRASRPERARPHLDAARAALLSPRFGDAVARADIERNPEFTWNVSDLEPALGEYQAAMRLDPTNDDVRLEATVVALARGRDPGSDDLFSETELREQYPRTYDAWQRWRKVPGAGDARRFDDRSAATHPRDPRAAGLFAFVTGRADLCIEAWNALEHTGGNDDPLVDAALGQVLLARGNTSLAYRRLSDAARALRNSPIIHLDLARCAISAGDFDAARAELWQARESRAARLDVLAIEAELLAGEGEYEAARRRFDETFRERARPRDLLAYSRFLSAQGEYDAALDAALRALGLMPEDPTYRSSCAEHTANWWRHQALVARTTNVFRAITAMGRTESRLATALRCLGPFALGESDADRPPGDAPGLVPHAVCTVWPVLHRSGSLVQRMVALLAATHDSLPSSEHPSARALLRGGYSAVLGLVRSLERFSPPGANSWIPLESSLAPTGRLYTAAATDFARGIVVLHGGKTNFYSVRSMSDTWEWGNGVWSRIDEAIKPGIAIHAMATDPIDGVIVFGGHLGGSYDVSENFSGETWRYANRRWTRIEGIAGPSPRTGAVMAFDPIRRRVVLFGGYSPPRHVADTWEWDGERWLLRETPHSPQPRRSGAMAFDPVRGVVMLHGGDDFQSRQRHRDTWVYDGVDWRCVSVDGPAPRLCHAAAPTNLVTGPIVLFGGCDNVESFADTWIWDGESWSELPTRLTPARRNGHALVTLPDSNGVLTAGGADHVWTGFHSTWYYTPDR